MHSSKIRNIIGNYNWGETFSHLIIDNVGDRETCSKN